MAEYDRARDVPDLRRLIGQRVVDICGPMDDEGGQIQVIFEDATVLCILPSQDPGNPTLQIEVEDDADV